jgi:translocator protein
MNNKFWYKFVILLMINFGALALGNAWTSSGVTSDWYVNANQAPWTPPGWVFGAAWFTIAVTFSAMMAFIDTSIYRHLDEVKSLFWFSVGLNVAWNPVFFWMKTPWGGVVVLSLLSFAVYKLVDVARDYLGWKVAIFGMPYFLWLMVATSLNMYFAIMN